MLTTSYLDGYAQAQYVGLYGLPDNAVASPGGPLGLGAAYFQANQSTNASNIFLKQAYLNFKFGSLGLPGAFLKIGRFEFMDGMEYRTGIDKFDSLKRTRVAQRLIASNVVHVGRSFDGFAAVYDRPAFDMTVSGIRPTQVRLTVQGQDEISDINVFYAALTSKKDVLLPGTEGRIFYVNYDDKRNTQVVDNRSVADRPWLNNQKLNIHTIGAHLLSLQQLGPGSIDALLWGAYQFGTGPTRIIRLGLSLPKRAINGPNFPSSPGCERSIFVARATTMQEMANIRLFLRCFPAGAPTPSCLSTIL